MSSSLSMSIRYSISISRSRCLIKEKDMRWTMPFYDRSSVINCGLYQRSWNHPLMTALCGLTLSLPTRLEQITVVTRYPGNAGWHICPRRLAVLETQHREASLYCSSNDTRTVLKTTQWETRLFWEAQMTLEPHCRPASSMGHGIIFHCSIVAWWLAWKPFVLE